MNPPAPPAEVIHAGTLAVMIASTAPGCRSLAELLERVPGAYPGEILAIADQLADDWLLDPGTRQRLHSRAVPHGGDMADTGVPLPAPHPLDYDWRWSARTVRELLARCLRLTRPADTIALLGTPTLLAATADRYHQRHWVLLEASSTAAALAAACPGQVLRCDLASDELPELGAQVVVADPPWYPADTRSFLWAAARITRPGAAVLLAQPAPATRPGVLAERAAILSFAHQAGLDVITAHPAALAYSSPPFERAALHAAGLLPLVPGTWRRGDLIVLRRTRTPAAPRPTAPEHGSWHDVSLDGTRIRFRTDAAGPDGMPADPRLVPITGEDDILPTVSRRDPSRDQARVWTGSNRVFGCQAPALLACIASALATGSPVTSAITRHLGRTPTAGEEHTATEAARQLRDLTRAEQRTAATTVAAALPSAASRTHDLIARSPL